MQRKSSCNTRSIAYLAYEDLERYITFNHIIVCPLFGFPWPLVCKRPLILKYIAINIGKNQVKQDLSLRTSIVGNSKSILKMNYNPTCAIEWHVVSCDLKKRKRYAMMQVAKKLLMPKFRALCGFM